MADDDYQRHLRAWQGFTRFVTYGLVAVLVVVSGLALTLL